MKNTLLTKSKGKVSSFLSDYGVFVSFALLCIVISMMTDKFFTVANFTNIFRQVSFNTIIAFGMSLVIASGGIDLSVGAVVSLSGIVCAYLSQNPDVPIGAIVLAGCAVGIVLGMVNGVIVSTLNLQPFIATMATTNIFRGIALILSGGKSVSGLSKVYKAIGAGKLLGIPLPVLFMLATLLVVGFVFYFTPFGRYVLAIGGNKMAAKFSGIKVKKITFLIYTLCGLLCGFTGVILTARLGAGSPTMSDGAELDAIAAAAIGGTNMSGGATSLFGTIVGALMLGIISNGMDLVNISPYYQRIVKGVIIIVAVLTDKKNRSR